MNRSGAPGRVSETMHRAQRGCPTAPSAWMFVISGALLAVALLTPGLLSPLNALRATNGTTSSGKAGRSRTPYSRTTNTGARKATNGRRRRCWSGCAKNPQVCDDVDAA